MKRYITLPLTPKTPRKWQLDFGIGTFRDTPQGRTVKLRHIGRGRASAALCLLAVCISAKALVRSTAKYIWEKRQGF